MWEKLDTAINKAMMAMCSKAHLDFLKNLKEEAMLKQDFKRHNGTDMPEEARGKDVTIKTRGGLLYNGKCEEFFWLWGSKDASINGKNIIEYYVHNIASLPLGSKVLWNQLNPVLFADPSTRFSPSSQVTRETYVNTDGKRYYSATAKEVADMVRNYNNDIKTLEEKIHTNNQKWAQDYEKLKKEKESKFDPWFKPIHEVFFNVYTNNIKLHPSLESAKDGKIPCKHIKTYKIDIKRLFEQGRVNYSTELLPLI